MAPFTILQLMFFPILLLSFVAGEVPALIVFGDSTVDAGNNNQIATILRSDFEPYGRDFPNRKPTGRFSNGRLATDFIAEGLGLGPLVPAYLDPDYNIADFAASVCFASAGTGLDNATSDSVGVIPLWQELELFKEYSSKLSSFVGETKAEQTLNEAIYIVSIGTNDFLENYFVQISGRYRQFKVDEYGSFLISIAADFVTKLHQLGARKIVFAGLSPMGCLPLERTAANFFHGRECIEEYNVVARDFNYKLKAMIKERSSALAGIKLKYNNIYDFFLQILKDPAAYGFENISEGCCGTGTYEMGFLCNWKTPFTCSDADKYIFWDSIHPSQKFNSLVGNHTLSTVIIPDLL